MAGNFFGNLMDKARTVYNNFFYDGAEAPAPRMPEEEMYPTPMQEQPYGQQAAAQQPGYPAGAPYGYQQYPQYQQAGFAPQQNPYQQGSYQQQPQEQQPAVGFAPQVAQQNIQFNQNRNRRSQQHASNVVDFGAYQHAQQQAQQGFQAQPAYQQQPSASAAETPAQPQAPQAPASGSARIINARGMGDCRSAITLLRNGDAVLIVLENVNDPAEMRRLVDTLSGACYSLTATITKVSRYGVYLLAPQTMAVYADQATNQMNGVPGRVPARNYPPQPSFAAAHRTAAYQQPQQNYQQTVNPYQPQPSAYAQQPQQGFTQRSAAPEEAVQPFYARTAPQAAASPAFSAQPAGYGYAPDEAAAAEQ